MSASRPLRAAPPVSLFCPVPGGSYPVVAPAPAPVIALFRGATAFAQGVETKAISRLSPDRPAAKTRFSLFFSLLSRRNRENAPGQPAPCAWMRAISRLLTSQKLPNTQMPAASIAKMITEPFAMPPPYQIASSLTGTATISVPST